MMTAQEIFDTVWRKMAAQGKKSADNGTCLYRSPDGSACAVGCLMTDDEAHLADNHIDGTGVGIIADAGLLPRHLAEHVGLLRSLQAAHDNSEFPWLENFQSAAHRIAKKLNLTVPA